MMQDKGRGNMSAMADVVRAAFAGESGMPVPRFTFDCKLYDADGNLKDSWLDSNVVTTEGLNKVLDVMFKAGSAITSWYLGLISSTSWSAVAATDTAANINTTNGWKEASSSYAPDYTTGSPSASRGGPITFGAISAAAVSSSVTVDYVFTGAGTVKGAFVVSNGTRGNTTGTLYSAATFTGGDKVVAGGDTLKVTVSLSFTS